MRPAAQAEVSALTRMAHRILLGVVLLAAVVLFVLWRSDNPRLERLRMGLTEAFAPALGWVGEPLAFLHGLYRDSSAYLDLYRQNRELRREIQQLRGWREAARRLEEENAQLRALNNVRLARRTTFVTGDVLADSGSPFRQSVLVNVGARDGVVDGSAAVDGNGLVGRVVGVGERVARILLLTDFTSRVPVEVRPSGRRAVLAGDATRAPRLEFLESDEDVAPGNLVRTSGDGGVFPPDLPVGRVVALADGSWRVALEADYDRLEFVRLIRYRPDTRIDRPGGLILRGRPAEPDGPDGIDGPAGPAPGG